jgi:hypothetical protein
MRKRRRRRDDLRPLGGDLIDRAVGAYSDHRILDLDDRALPRPLVEQAALLALENAVPSGCRFQISFELRPGNQT